MARGIQNHGYGSLTSMFALMTMLMIYAAMLLPAQWATLLLFAAGLFVAPLVMEREWGKACIVYVCGALFALLCGGFACTAPYVLFAGWYGIVKFLLTEMKDGLLRWLLKLLLFHLAIGLMAWLAPDPLLTAWTSRLSVWWLIPIAEASFLLFDLALTGFATFYREVLRDFLLK